MEVVQGPSKDSTLQRIDNNPVGLHVLALLFSCANRLDRLIFGGLMISVSG